MQPEMENVRGTSEDLVLEQARTSAQIAQFVSYFNCEDLRPYSVVKSTGLHNMLYT